MDRLNYIESAIFFSMVYSSEDLTITAKVLNFPTPKMFAVITLKFKQKGFSIEKFIQNVGWLIDS